MSATSCVPDSVAVLIPNVVSNAFPLTRPPMSPCAMLGQNIHDHFCFIRLSPDEKTSSLMSKYTYIVKANQQETQRSEQSNREQQCAPFQSRHCIYKRCLRHSSDQRAVAEMS